MNVYPSCKYSVRLALFLADRTVEGKLCPTCLTTSRAPLAQAVRTFPSSYRGTQTIYECTVSQTDRWEDTYTIRGTKYTAKAQTARMVSRMRTTTHTRVHPLWQRAYRIIRIGPSNRGHQFFLMSIQKIWWCICERPAGKTKTQVGDQARSFLTRLSATSLPSSWIRHLRCLCQSTPKCLVLHWSCSCQSERDTIGCPS